MDKALVERVISATCAICFIPVPVEIYRQDKSRTALNIVGTGFLVRSTTVITNRHVLQAIEDYQATLGVTDDELFALFCYPTTTGLREVYCSIKQYSHLQHRSPEEHEKLDIGFIDVVLPEVAESEFQDHCQPLEFVDRCVPDIGEPIAVCGYPYGAEALRKESHRFYRFGPVLQHGHVSAVAPFHNARPEAIEELLLDIRTAGGMSGAPVVRQSDGLALGVHWGGFEATMALAVPIDKTRLSKWLRGHDQSLSDPRGPTGK
jgi:V8-like Glu-specific endopeptidase